MTRYKFTIFLSAIITTLFSTSFVPESKLQHTTQVSNIDSVPLSPNAKKGWTIFSYYLHQETSDSVEFELILKHNNDINWANEQWIGTITSSSYIPVKEQFLTYYLLPGNSWNMHIKTDGKCYFNFIKGSLPPGDSIIIPIKVKYKNN